jgi:hypothetical protein
MMRERLLASLRLAAWTGGLVVAWRLLVAAGSETLSVPSTSLDDLSVWMSDTPPADMAIALLRLAALAAVAYLLGATALAVAARLFQVRPLVAAADILSPDLVRRLVTGGSGLGLVLGGAVAAVPASDLPPGSTGGSVAVTAAPHDPQGSGPTPSATMARLPDATATMTPLEILTPPGEGGIEPGTGARDQATMTRIDPAPSSATMTRVPAPPPAAPRPEATPAAYTPTAPAATPATLDVDPSAWVVEPGDSLWSIAEDVTSSAAGTPPSERDVSRYWRRLVHANRANLVDPDNPDLLLPGQQIVVPPTDG